MNSKTILLWGALPELPKGEPYEVAYKRSGNNFGNTLIGNGVVSVLKGYQYIYRSQLAGPDDANEKCCHIVIPAANFLWQGFDFGYMADFIEATTLPVTIIGLGAQTNDRSLVAKIHPNTLRLVKMISERSPSLGVRGFYTAEVLAAHGILNVSVLGCPSLYANGRLSSHQEKCAVPAVNNLIVNFSRRVSAHSFDPQLLRKVENALLRLAIVRGLPFVAQDELEELALAHGKASDPDCERITTYFNELEKRSVLDYFRKNTSFFYNVTDWSQFMATRSGCIGSRLHGNIMALVNGVPSLTVVHDSRTLEMCALTGAPYVHVKECSGGDVSSEFLVEKLRSANYNLFFANMAVLLDRYKAFLGEHELENSL